MSLKRPRPDLIFMDLQMPEVSGYDATRQIREIELGEHHSENAGRLYSENGHGVPIIALTAGPGEDDRKLCVESGMK